MKNYASRQERGRARMRGANVVICGLSRDIRPWLPRVAARVEHLGGMFRRYQVVCYEADSVDETPKFLDAWAQPQPGGPCPPGRPRPGAAAKRRTGQATPADLGPPRGRSPLRDRGP